MEIRAFYGESGHRNFEARNYMEKLDYVNCEYGEYIEIWT